jgi:hypothetical protein
VNPLVDAVYRILVHKRFRSGSLPAQEQATRIRQLISTQVEEGRPVGLFQYWGGCKNPHLASQRADICEEHTLQNLQRLHLAVQAVYPPGLRIILFPGDARISRVNGIPIDAARAYVKDLEEIAARVSDILTVVPVSLLYERYAAAFGMALQRAEALVSREVYTQPEFHRLYLNAQKNVRREDGTTLKRHLVRCRAAARGYIVYRVAEEVAGIYSEYADCIRCSFIRLSPFHIFYKQYLPNLDAVRPSLNSVLHFYTGSKGNITQPWQALGCTQVGKRIVYISSSRSGTAQENRSCSPEESGYAG